MDVAVGHIRDAGVAHLDASRRDVAIFVPKMDEHALAVVAAAPPAARRQKPRPVGELKWSRYVCRVFARMKRIVWKKILQS